MIVANDNIKNNNNGSDNSNRNNKYQMGLTIQDEIIVQRATI